MNKHTVSRQPELAVPNLTSLHGGGLLQRKCTCGQHATDQHGECTACSKNRRTLQRMAVNQRAPQGAPPLVHEVLRSPGKPLDARTRAFMEPRFGHDFSRVRVHTDAKAASSARAMNALAYTVGQDLVFGAGQYAPESNEGRKLLAHELTHTVQQAPAIQNNSGSIILLDVTPAGRRAETEADQLATGALAPQRQSTATQMQAFGLQRQPFDTPRVIPSELRMSVDVSKMSDEQLQARYDAIQAVLSQFDQSTADTVALEEEAGAIGVELARRRALAEGRTFTTEAVERMRAYFTRNARTQEDGACIVALNKGMKLLLNDPKQPTTNKSIEKTMEKIAASGRSSEAREIWFETGRGRLTRGGARPERLRESVWDAVISMAGDDPGWSVMTMSLLDGYHTVALTLDNSNPTRPRIYWSDQWQSKGGWKEYTRSTLDAEVTKLVQGWWDKQAEGKKHKTVVRLWRLRQGAQGQP